MENGLPTFQKGITSSLKSLVSVFAAIIVNYEPISSIGVICVRAVVEGDLPVDLPVTKPIHQYPMPHAARAVSISC